MDSSRAVKVTIWMYYDETTVGELTYVSVSQYKTKWQLYDSSTSMSSASMEAGCIGASLPGDDDCNPEKYTSKWIGYPTSGNTYSLMVPWAGNYIVTSGLLGYQAGNFKVQLRRGSSTWWLEICIFKGSCAID